MTSNDIDRFFPVDLLGPHAWYMPTTICGTLVVAAGFLTLFVSFGVL